MLNEFTVVFDHRLRAFARPHHRDRDGLRGRSFSSREAHLAGCDLANAYPGDYWSLALSALWADKTARSDHVRSGQLQPLIMIAAQHKLRIAHGQS